MKHRNTLSKKRYLFENIFWSIIMMMWYHNQLFRCVNGVNYSVSRLILWGMTIALVFFGVLMTWKRRRNNLSLFVNVSIPFEIYGLITYYRHIHILIWIAAAVAVLLCVDYSSAIFTMPIKNEAKKRAVITNRIKYSALGCRTIIAGCFSVMILCLGVSAIFRTFIFSPSVKAGNGDTTEAVTIAENIEVVSQLNQDIWDTITTQERLNTLQTVANIETSYLGLPHELNVKLGNLSESTLACYDDETHIITIDMDHFDHSPAEEVLTSVCHEAYHAYQHRLCNVYDSVDEEYQTLRIFRSSKTYKEEFSNYISGDDDALGYYVQKCEIDARAYAESAVDDYYTKINDYLGIEDDEAAEETGETEDAEEAESTESAAEAA